MATQFFKDIDLISPTPYFFIDGKKRIKTVFGGILLMLNGLLILGLSIYFLNKLVSRSSNNVNYNIKPITTNQTSYNLSFTGKPFIITLTNTLSEILPDEGLFNILGQTTKFYLDDSKKITGERKFFEMEKCDINKHFGQYRKFYEEVPELNKYFCLKDIFKDIDIYGVWGGISQIFAFQINKCVNDSSNNFTKCRSDVSNVLENVYVSIKFLDYLIQHDYFENPYEMYLRSDQVTASSTVYKRAFYFMKQVKYLTDIGFVFEDIKTEYFYQYPDPKETVDLRSQGILPGNFINVSFVMDKKIDIFKKTYMKLQELLAVVGGIIKLFTQVSIILLSLVFYNSYYMEVCNLYEESDKVETVNNLISFNYRNYRSCSYSKPLILNKNKKFEKSLRSMIFNFRVFHKKKEEVNNYVIFNKIKKIVSKEISVDNIFERMIKFDIFKKFFFTEKEIELFKNSVLNKDWFTKFYDYEKKIIGETSNFDVSNLVIRNEKKLNDFLKY